MYVQGMDWYAYISMCMQTCLHLTVSLFDVSSVIPLHQQDRKGEGGREGVLEAVLHK